MSKLRYDNRVFVITGAGGGLGKAYASFFASRGGSVVVNDAGGSYNGQGSVSTKVSLPGALSHQMKRIMEKHEQAADAVVNEINAAGGKAFANYDRVENGEKIIQTAIDHFGRIDVLINYAGILQETSFENMTDADWDMVMAAHVRGAYKCTRAAWPYFRKQRYGRIINASSASGLFGSSGQTNDAGT
jgi:multifunctional beta-oxidation protein